MQLIITSTILIKQEINNSMNNLLNQVILTIISIGNAIKNIFSSNLKIRNIMHKIAKTLQIILIKNHKLYIKSYFIIFTANISNQILT